MVWLLTYFQFPLQGGSGDFNAFASQGKGVKRKMTEEFTELKPRYDNRGRRTMFGNMAGEAYRYGTENRSSLRRSSDLRYDNDL